jgi:hypothetical protein
VHFRETMQLDEINLNSVALVNFVAVEAPTAGMAVTRESLEVFDAEFGIVLSGESLKIVANELMPGSCQGLWLFGGHGRRAGRRWNRNFHVCFSIPDHRFDPGRKSRFLTSAAQRFGMTWVDAARPPDSRAAVPPCIVARRERADEVVRSYTSESKPTLVVVSVVSVPHMSSQVPPSRQRTW